MSKIVAIRRVNAYETTDKETHRTREAAARHQAMLDLAALLTAEIPFDVGEPASPETVAAFLLTKAEAVTALLRTALPKRAQKAVASAPAATEPAARRAAA